MLRDRLDTFRKRFLLPSALALVAAGVLGWGIYQNQLRASYEAQLQNMYTRSFYELVDNMDNLQVKLSKLMVSNSTGGNVQLLSDISRQADSAADKLSALPVSHPALANTMGLISLAGDYCRSLTNKAADGHPLTVDDVENLKKLYNNCVSISDELRQMQTDGKVDFTNITNRSYYENATDGMSTRFSERESGGVDYPTMIYDGPFSESIASSTPKGLPYTDTDEAAAKAAVQNFLGLKDQSSISIASLTDSKVQTYVINCTSTANYPVNIQVSKQGGKVLQMIEESGSATPTLSAEDCTLAATNWLAGMGFGQVKATFSQQYDGLLVINFAPVQDNAVLYTDLIKVKVRMDDGRVCGFDALGYYMNHTARTPLTPVLTREDAQKLVSTQLQVNAAQLALIPMAGGGERLCWEYKGTFGSDNFIVYIDAVTGEEATVFKIVNTDNGSLVVQNTASFVLIA